MRLNGLAVLVSVAFAAAAHGQVPAAFGHHWEARAGASDAVLDFVAGLPAAKASHLRAVDGEIVDAKQYRTCVARQAPRTSVQPQVFRSLMSPTITRTDTDGGVLKRRAIRELDDQIVALYAYRRQVVADGLWLPPRRPLEWRVGATGALPPAVVWRVVDGHNLIAKSCEVTFWLSGVDTGTVVDGQPVDVATTVRVKGTHAIRDVYEAYPRTVYECEPFDPRADLVAVPDGPRAAPARATPGGGAAAPGRASDARVATDDGRVSTADQ